MQPKDVAGYLRAYAEYCGDLKDRLNTALKGKTKEEIQAITEANRSRMDDLVDPLLEALDGVNRAQKAIGPTKQKGLGDWKKNSGEFVRKKTSLPE